MHFFESKERLLRHNERRQRTRARPNTHTHTQTRMLMQSQFIFGHQTRIVSRSKNGTIIAASTPKLRKQTNHQTSAVTRPKSNNIPSSSRRRRRSSSSSSSSSRVMSTTIVMASSSTGLFDCPIFAEKTLDKFQQSTSSTKKATTEEASFVRE